MNTKKSEWAGAERALEGVGRWVLGHRAATLVAIALVTMVLGAGLSRIAVNNANELWFAEGDETVRRYDELTAMFGSDEFLFLLLRTEDVFSAETLDALDAITAALESIEYHGEPAIEQVTHIANVGFVRGEDDVVEVVELSDGLGRDAEGLAAMRRRAFDTPAYEGLLVNRDATATGIVIGIPSIQDDDQFHPFLADILRSRLAEPPLDSLDLVIAGGAILDADMDRATAEESVVFGLLALMLNALVMAFLFRRAAGVVIPITVVVLTLTWTLGLMGHLGVAINIAHVILPAMLIAVSISDSVHILSEYQTERQNGLTENRAIIRTVGQVGLACLLTTATTAAGMGSLALAPVPPLQSLGIFAAVGVFVAYILTMTLVPTLLSVLGLDAKKTAIGRRHVSAGILRWLSALTVRRAKSIIAVGAVAIVVAAVGASQIVIETDFVAAFKSSFPTRRAFNAIDATLGGTSSLQMVLDTGVEGGVKDPAFLERLSQLQIWFETRSEKVTKTLSVADLVQNMNQVLADGDPHAYAIPDTRPAVAQQLLLYENSDPDGLFELVTDNYQIARLDIRTRSGGTREATQLMNDADDYAANLFGPDVSFHFTGVSNLFVQMAENLSRGQIYSYGAAFSVILLLMIAMLRSVPFGLWSMVPNLLPVMVTLGVMGFSGIRLDFITLLIACVAIGIAVDDTIHFLVRFKKLLAETGDPEQAIQGSLQSVGRAMMFTTVILCVGFLTFTPSVMASVASFGALVALTVFTAFIADVLLMPALLVAVVVPSGGIRGQIAGPAAGPSLPKTLAQPMAE